jgi:F-type H+-transporting ATPase subunit epsilon
MLKLNVFTPERKVLEGRTVSEVTLPGSEGQIQILPGHETFVGTFETGPFSYRVEGEGQAVGVISSGFFSVTEDVVTLTVETLEMSGEIDLERARAAQALAEKTLQQADLEEKQFKKYQLKLQRSIIRQQVGGTTSSGN